jgi:ABC-2 type transport system ATP-binding protein
MHALSIKNLTKTYQGGFQAVKGIDLTIEEGDFFALLGPNGAGKSTTINVLCSLVQKTSGKVTIFGTDIDKDFAKAKTHLGIVPQEFNFNMFETAMQIVMNQAGYYGVPRSIAKTRAEKYLKQLGLWEKRHKNSRTLSGGMKRRLMIARALMHEPRLLILDEPTAGVDIELRRSMWHFLKTINEAGVTIILTTHYLEEAEYLCKKIAIIDKGKIIENTSMQALLQRLDQETFILDVAEPLPTSLDLKPFSAKRAGELNLEIDLTRGMHLNEVFALLDKHNIRVVSMRNKVNRLEELFVRLTHEGQQS